MKIRKILPGNIGKVWLAEGSATDLMMVDILIMMRMDEDMDGQLMHWMDNVDVVDRAALMFLIKGSFGL